MIVTAIAPFITISVATIYIAKNKGLELPQENLG